LLAVATSLCLVACFAKTTSLGSADNPVDGVDGSDASNKDAGSAPDALFDADALATSDASDGGSGLACQIADPMLPVAPCPTVEYCRSDDGSCGGAAHCTTTPNPPPPACPALECGCDGVVRCRDHSRPLGTDVAPKGYCGVTCGTKTCDGVTEYCLHGAGGVMTPDGGGSTYFACNPIPAACATNHTCACLQSNSGSAGSCTEKGGKLDLDVPLP
jgi:hypothetical protein